MFLETQSSEQKGYYERMLKVIGSLSGLYSESESPYLHYRTTENLFCKAFDAINLSRGDSSADASKNNLGFGIKTFLNSTGNSFQKVAEFNKDFLSFSHLSNRDFVLKISELRNGRIDATKRIYNLSDIFYHCITREPGKINIFETNMDRIDTSRIGDIKKDASDKSIKFEDGLNEYSFSITKSTLYKRFKTENILLSIPVEILNDPFTTLEKLLNEVGSELVFSEIKDKEHIFLPLYSSKGTRHVPDRSGLNQWNARGRSRDPDEVYIPIPIWIHRKFPHFFPDREVKFTLRLPSNEEISAKICQENSKALMSDPNKALGKWLLRDVMNLSERELLTIDKLDIMGLDSVVIYKIDASTFQIDFTKQGTFDAFEKKVMEGEEIVENDEGELI